VHDLEAMDRPTAPIISTLHELQDFLRHAPVVRIPATEVQLHLEAIPPCASGSVCDATFGDRTVTVKRLRLRPAQDQEPCILYQAIAWQLWTHARLCNLSFAERLIGVVLEPESISIDISQMPIDAEMWLIVEPPTGTTPLADVAVPEDRTLWSVNLITVLVHHLVAMHELGIFHLDLNPQNILLTPGGDIFLVGFGMPAVASAAASDLCHYRPLEQVLFVQPDLAFCSVCDCSLWNRDPNCCLVTAHSRLRRTCLQWVWLP
jgi:hypothetical protein